MKRSMVFLSLALLVSCGGGGGNTTPPPPPVSFSLQLPESEVTVMQGDSKAVTINIQRENGFADEVVLGLAQPSPNKFGSTFSKVNATQSKLTLNAPINLPTGLYTVYIKGSAGDQNASATLKVNVSKSPLITVGGTLKNIIGGKIQSATVKIRGFNSIEKTTTSNTSGQFKIEGVLAPYTATVSFPDGETHTFTGLTSPNPALKLWSASGVVSATKVSVSGTLSGGDGFPNPVGAISQAVYISLYDNLGTATLFQGQGGAYTINTTQVNETTAQGMVFALQWQANSSGPTSIPVKYNGFGKSAPILGNFTSRSNINIDLKPVGQSVLSGEVLPQADMTVLWKTMGAALVPRGGFVLAADYSSSSNFSYPIPTPDELQGKYFLAVGAQSTSGSQLILNQANISEAETRKFPLLNPPVLSLPADKATGAGNVLSWEKGTFKNPLYIVRYQATGGVNQYIYTTQTSFAAPLAKNTAYKWNMAAYDGFPTMDAFVQPEVYPFGYPNAGSILDFQYGQTREQTFTTAP